MQAIKPDILAKFRSSLKYATIESQKSISDKTTSKFNSTHSKIKSQASAAALNLSSLPKVKAPFLPPPKQANKTYTLVLDLDETLIHFVDLSH